MDLGFELQQFANAVKNLDETVVVWDNEEKELKEALGAQKRVIWKRGIVAKTINRYIEKLKNNVACFEHSFCYQSELLKENELFTLIPSNLQYSAALNFITQEYVEGNHERLEDVFQMWNEIIKKADKIDNETLKEIKDSQKIAERRRELLILNGDKTLDIKKK